MSDILIETYRGFPIFFNADNERFYTEIDGSGWREKQSFGAVKLFIDQYVKDNHTFKPFRVMQLGSMWKSNTEVEVIGIRKDERFVYDDKGKKRQISDYEEKDWFLVDPANEKPLATIAIYESEIKELEAKIKEEKGKLKKVTLESIKANYLPPK